jgi:hypothetical protein
VTGRVGNRGRRVRRAKSEWGTLLTKWNYWVECRGRKHLIEWGQAVLLIFWRETSGVAREKAKSCPVLRGPTLRYGSTGVTTGPGVVSAVQFFRNISTTWPATT